jgi:hypothetical protein
MKSKKSFCGFGANFIEIKKKYLKLPRDYRCGAERRFHMHKACRRRIVHQAAIRR